ncbi:MAG: 3-deoxy-manno-octulosonate cytidylyltransferase [Terriglobales bacterium]
MKDRMKVLAVIPARLASTRLARKALREIAGVPMVGRVFRAVAGVLAPENVLIATDSGEILDLCRARGWNVEMTSPEHRSGTERVHEIAQRRTADVYLNIQGDEPLTRPEHIRDLIAIMQSPGVQVGTLKTAMVPADIQNANAVKVVTAADGRALYFSRAAIPFDRDRSGTRYFKHLGFYGYRREALARFCTLPESELERSERLEQLRFLENGTDIIVGATAYDTIGVDTEDDLRRAENLLLSRG